MATQTELKPPRADTKLELTPPDPVPVVAGEGLRAGPGQRRHQEQARRESRRLRRRTGRARCAVARVRQEGRPDDQHGPQGNHVGGADVQPLPRPADPGDGQGQRRRRQSRRAAPTVEELDPGQGDSRPRRKILGIIPFGNSMKRVLRQLPVGPRAHPVDPRATSPAARTSC